MESTARAGKLHLASQGLETYRLASGKFEPLLNNAIKRLGRSELSFLLLFSLHFTMLLVSLIIPHYITESAPEPWLGITCVSQVLYRVKKARNA